MLEDGIEVRARTVLSNATPQITFLDLLPEVRQTLKLNASALVVVLSLSSLLFLSWSRVLL